MRRQTTNPIVVKRKTQRPKRIITIKKEHGRSIYSEKVQKESLICSNKLPVALKAKILLRLDPESLAKLCLTSKKCQENYCQNKRLWDNFAIVKFDTIAPDGVNYFEYYYGRKLYEIDSVDTEQVFPNIKAIKSVNGTDGFLDFAGNYVKRTTGETMFFGLNTKFYKENYVLVNDILYELMDSENLELVEVTRNVKCVCEHDWVNEMCIMTNNVTYIHNTNIKQSSYYQGVSGQMTIEHGKNDLHILTVVIDNIDYSTQIKYVKFVYGSHAGALMGLICLDTGLLYYFDTNRDTPSGTVQYYQLASNVRLANILYPAATIYWIDYKENLNILDRYQFLHENEDIEKSTTVYPTTSPIIKLIAGYEGHYDDWIESPYYTMYILDQTGALYVHNDTPSLNIINDIHTHVDKPELILTGVLDFFLDSGDTPLYVLTY